MTQYEAIERLKNEGKSWREVGEALGLSREAVRNRYRRWKDKGEMPPEDRTIFNKLYKVLKKGPKTLDELSEVIDRAPSSVSTLLGKMSQAGYSIQSDMNWVTVSPLPILEDAEQKPLFGKGKTFECAFGVAGDLHQGSKFEQVSALRDFVHIAKEEYGVEHILNPGDTYAGTKVYRGQEMDNYVFSGMDQVEVGANNRPTDVHWYDLGGNHDYSFYKASGIDVRRRILDYRDDITLLDYDVADVPLLPGIDARLWHPSGGPAYALSYRGQKYASQLAFQELMDVTVGDKPKPTIRLLLIGHFHTFFMFDQGPITVLGTGCFEGQNSYLKRKGLIPSINGTIFKCKFIDGMLHRLEFARIKYREIEEDWRYWYSKNPPQRSITKMVPIFSAG